MRIVKFTKDGKFIKTLGQTGFGPRRVQRAARLAFDSQGRLFVADRANNRLQIFDQDGKFLEEWKQFSRLSGIYIDKNDVLYGADSESNTQAQSGVEARHPCRQRAERQDHRVHPRPGAKPGRVRDQRRRRHRR